MRRPGKVVQIYVENLRGREPAYRVAESQLRRALEGIDLPIMITERLDDNPDIEALGESDFFIGWRFDPTRLAAYGKKLRIIHCTASGIERYLPLGWIPEGATFTNSRGIHAEKATEFGMLALLMLNNHIPQHATNQRSRSWKRPVSDSIRRKTVMIYGVGAMGGAVAKAAKALGMIVFGVRRTGEPHPDVDRMLRPRQFSSVLPEVDFLVVSCAVTPATQGSIGARQIGLLREHRPDKCLPRSGRGL